MACPGKAGRLLYPIDGDKRSLSDLRRAKPPRHIIRITFYPIKCAHSISKCASVCFLEAAFYKFMQLCNFGHFCFILKYCKFKKTQKCVLNRTKKHLSEVLRFPLKRGLPFFFCKLVLLNIR